MVTLADSSARGISVPSSPFSEEHGDYFQGQQDKLLYLRYISEVLKQDWSLFIWSLKFSSVSEHDPKAFEMIWIWRRDRQFFICGHWTSVIGKQFLNLYRRVMSSVDMLYVQIAVPEVWIKWVWHLDWMNVGGPNRQTGPAAVLSTAVVSCD